MFLRAAATLIPRPRPSSLPAKVLATTATASLANVAAYNAVCGFPLTDMLPATYPHILAFPQAMRLMSRPDFPFPVVGLVHIANRITLSRPIAMNATLCLTVRAANLRPHYRGTQFDVLTTAAVDGAVVWSQTSTYLRRGPAVAGSATSSASPDEELAGPPAAIWHVASSVGPDYATVSGDNNPIHISWLGARLFGFPRPIAHGMWSKARLLASLKLPKAYSVDVRFRAPIFLGSRVEMRTSANRAEVRSRDRLHLAAAIS